MVSPFRKQTPPSPDEPATTGGGSSPFRQPDRRGLLQRLADAYVKGKQQGITGFIQDLPENYAKGQQQLNYEGALADKARVFANDLTFNAADPVAGLLNTPITDLFSPGQNIEAQRKATESARERLPAGFELASGVLGGAASGTGLAKGGLTLTRFAPQARTLGAGAVRAGITGGEQAALSGLGAYNRGDDWSQIGTEALFGAGAGTLGSALGGIAGRAKARGTAAAEVPPGAPKTRDEAFTQGGAKFENVKKSGATYTDTKPLKSDIDAALADEVLHAEGDKAILNVVKQVKKDLSSKTGISPYRLERSRRYVKEKLVTGVKDDNQRRIGRDLMQKIEDYAGRSSVDVPPGSTATAADINKELKEARTLWSKGKQVQRVDEAMEEAASRAGRTGSALSPSGGNLENTRRQEIGKLVTASEKGKLPSAYSPEVLPLMREIEGGTLGRDIGRYGATVSPLRGGVQSAIAGAGGFGGALANPGLALKAAPYLALATAGAEGLGFAGRKATERSIDDLRQMILSGVDPRGDPATVNLMRDLLARTAAGATRGGRQAR